MGSLVEFLLASWGPKVSNGGRWLSLRESQSQSDREIRIKDSDFHASESPLVGPQADSPCWMVGKMQQ